MKDDWQKFFRGYDLVVYCLPGLDADMGCSSNANDHEPPIDHPVRETTQGPVRGVEEDTLLAFRGIL